MITYYIVFIFFSVKIKKKKISSLIYQNCLKQPNQKKKLVFQIALPFHSFVPIDPPYLVLTLSYFILPVLCHPLTRVLFHSDNLTKVQVRPVISLIPLGVSEALSY